LKFYRKSRTNTSTGLIADWGGANADRCDQWLSLPVRRNQRQSLFEIEDGRQVPEFLEGINNPGII
jgi:hypothetical protein